MYMIIVIENWIISDRKDNQTSSNTYPGQLQGLNIISVIYPLIFVPEDLIKASAVVFIGILTTWWAQTCKFLYTQLSYNIILLLKDKLSMTANTRLRPHTNQKYG